MSKVTQVIVMHLQRVTAQHIRWPANFFFFLNCIIFLNTTLSDLSPTHESVFEAEWKDGVSALLSREEPRPIISV